MELVFRQTQESDIEDLFRVRARTRENPISKERLAALGVTPASSAAALKAGVIGSWVCTHEEQVVGFCSADSTTGEILVLAVLPDYERKGVGKRLLEHIVKWLWSHGGVPQLWLAASPDPRVRAHGFYRSQGWRPTGERDAHGDEILVLDPA